MKNRKLVKNIYYFLSLMCYLVAILFITKSNSQGMGVLWFVFGSACLTFANVFYKKNKED